MLEFTRKEYNSYLLLNLINKYGAISRTHLFELTGLRAATITDIIKELLDKEIIKEEGVANCGRGRNQKLLKIYDDYLCALGISIEVDEITFLVSTFNGKILKKVIKSITSCIQVDQIISLILEVSESLIKEYSHKRILGVGLGDPGVLDVKRELSLFSSQFKGWGNIPFKSLLETSLKLPVLLENNDRLKALGEMKYGLAKNVDNFICLQLGGGSGIGLSIVADGNLLRGFNAVSGEIGHIHVNDNNNVCVCGNFGCLETIASLAAIKSQIKSALNQGVSSIIRDFIDDIDNISFESIKKAVSLNDKLCINIIENAGNHIGMALSYAINILNPEMVIFESKMSELGDVLLNPIKSAVYKNSLNLVISNLVFVISDLKELSAPLGAITMIFDEFLREEYFRKTCSSINVPDTHQALSLD